MLEKHDSNGRIRKRQQVISLLRNHRGLLVALSGGVDSAVLLALAREALGAERVIAVTGRSSAVTEAEIEDAKAVARSFGVRHEILETHEIERAEYRQNAGNRCFHCRSELFDEIARFSRRLGWSDVAYGAIVDDLDDHRPGMTAAKERGVFAPLLEANISKSDVREFAKELNIHIQDKPANACLASRIPVGTEVTVERLNQVADAESALRAMGFRQLRVRHHGELARIELGPGEARRLDEGAKRDAVVSAVKAAGFRFVTLDLEAYGTAKLHSIEPARAGGQ